MYVEIVLVMIILIHLSNWKKSKNQTIKNNKQQTLNMLETSFLFAWYASDDNTEETRNSSSVRSIIKAGCGQVIFWSLSGDNS
jgi:hypothetical protein